jgi:glycosyltransferase involved in cell wall biosynthesis
VKQEPKATALVSVVVPFHGLPEQLARAVESIAAQTASVAEVIIVDDASPSGPDGIAALRTRDWPFRLRCLRHEQNMGPGEARNTGWSAADPDIAFLAFLDADDTWHPAKIAVQADWMLAHPAFSWTAHRCGALAASEMPQDVTFHELGPSGLLRTNSIATPTVMVRRHVETRFRHGWRYCEDLMLWLDLLNSGERGALLHIPLAMLGRRPKTCGGMTGMLREMHRGELRVIDALESEQRLSSARAVTWRSWLRLKYLARRVMR